MRNLNSDIIPLNSESKPRGLYFSNALFEGLIFAEGLIFEGAYLRREVRAPKEAVMAQNCKAESADTAVMVII